MDRAVVNKTELVVLICRLRRQQPRNTDVQSINLRGRYGLRASDTAWKPAPFRGKLFSLLRMVTGKYPGYPLRITMK